MEKKNNSGLLVGILIGIIITLIIGICLFATNIISFSNTKDSNKENSTIDDSNMVTTIEQEEANKIAKKLFDQYYDEIFYGHSAPYCGKKYIADDSEYYKASNGEEYKPSLDYKTKEELIKHLSTYLSNKHINKIITPDDYIEKDGKLYCLQPRKGALIYEKENSEFNANEMSYEYFYGKGKVAYTSGPGPIDTINITFKCIKENDNWVIDEVEEEQ